MPMGGGLKPKVNLSCPACGEALTFQMMFVNRGDATWALSGESMDHLKGGH